MQAEQHPLGRVPLAEGDPPAVSPWIATEGTGDVRVIVEIPGAALTVPVEAYLEYSADGLSVTSAGASQYSGLSPLSIYHLSFPVGPAAGAYYRVVAGGHAGAGVVASAHRLAAVPS